MGGFYNIIGKRSIDFFLASLALLILGIPAIIIAIIIKLDSSGGALFVQKRLGFKKNVFSCYKFRTMVKNAERLGGTTTFEDDKRITKVGKIIRKYSLDEIPQLINIIKGEMAIIGPRPLPKSEWDSYGKEYDIIYKERWNARPGLFCTIDVDLREAAPKDVQFSRDVDYVKNISLVGDVKVLFAVIHNVVTGNNVYSGKENER